MEFYGFYLIIEHNGNVSLKLDGSISGSLFTFPSFLGWNDADTLFGTGGKDAAGLPPFVVAGVRHVQNIAELERKPSARQTVVFVRIIFE